MLVEFPFVVHADDYHEFDNLKNVLNKVGNAEVNYKEIQISDGNYTAVFYLGETCPSIDSENLAKMKVVGNVNGK